MSLTPIVSGESDDLDITRLCHRYATGEATPERVLREVLARIADCPTRHIWIERLSDDDLLLRARALGALTAAERNALPLYGVPFAVKDNIDVASYPTTAACPDFAYVATRTATVVARLEAAGAMLIGKTNLDQFATGLVGTRSPYGACDNAIDPAYVAGGSSSGSAVAVARGLVSFSLGTDTAGSGRVPAACNGVIGFKPTRGLVSTAGVVPACRSLDCIAVFTHSVTDAERVLNVALGEDARDPYSRSQHPRPARPALTEGEFRFGVPAAEFLRFYGDTESRDLFAAAVEHLEALGGRRIEIDFASFLAAGSLLYDGPWVAERLAAIGHFMHQHPEALLPITRRILEDGMAYDAAETFTAQYRLAALRRSAEMEMARVDVLITPTIGTQVLRTAVEAEPMATNRQLGYYTQFVNLLDQCAIAVPAGQRADGMPFGLSLIAPGMGDCDLLTLAARFMGELPALAAANDMPDEIHLAVVGAHLSGQPLNHQLLTCGAHLLRRCRTAPAYRLYALRATKPPKPGLVRSFPSGAGESIEVEVWAMPADAFGGFIREIPPPLCIGSVELESGEWVQGFLCEPHALVNGDDITAHGGWRAYLRAKEA
ncbi:allophanate hydrolase [Acidihalobacter yilgarnensis]|uniref:Allophanate hydrolase n=1 Tax=Acidihalobacter yilgarnensis TaxID=2819280 RepID=A0A1D8IKK8_9GAMM|nr:allophanate hydrolase [Acidihalobacter yilgarnensis]AOU96998.1 allophanate hydrolase [Acidihalobacter yilgarnensis]